MARVEITPSSLIVHLEGLDKLWALKSRLAVPLAHVQRVQHDPSVGFPSLLHIRLPGTYVPGVIAAGTFLTRRRREFWAVHHPQRAVVVELADHPYDRLVIEVQDPQTTVARIAQATARSSPPPPA